MEAVPADGDRFAAEVPHVGVQRLPTSDHQKDRAQREERLHRLVLEEADGPHRIDGLDDLWRMHDVAQAEQRDHREPHDHDRPEHSADGTGAALLHAEQTDEDGHRDRDDPALERGRHLVEALHRAEHGDGGGDDAVAIEQRGTEHPEADQQAGLDHRALALHHQAGERQDAAFTMVVGLHHEEEVLQRDDHHQGPEGERAHPEHVDAVDGEHVCFLGERLAKGVQRAGADIAVDHPQCSDDQCTSLDRRVLLAHRRRTVASAAVTRDVVS